MHNSWIEKIGGLAIILGAVLFAAYAGLFTVLLPIEHGQYDMAQLANHPNWIRLAITALLGIVLMLTGYYFVYQRIRSSSGVVGALGFWFVEVAYLLQACKVTWELFLYPVIAAHSESAFLLREQVLKHDLGVQLFRGTASVTIFIGVTLFCLALYRSEKFPRVAPVLIFAGAIIYALGPLWSLSASITGILIHATGCSLLGVRLLNRSVPAQGRNH